MTRLGVVFGVWKDTLVFFLFFEINCVHSLETGAPFCSTRQSYCRASSLSNRNHRCAIRFIGIPRPVQVLLPSSPILNASLRSGTCICQRPSPCSGQDAMVCADSLSTRLASCFDAASTALARVRDKPWAENSTVLQCRATRSRIASIFWQSRELSNFIHCCISVSRTER
jgi:hypothetical protein